MGGKARRLPPSAFLKLHAALAFLKFCVRLLLLLLLVVVVVVVVGVGVVVVVVVVAKLEGGWGGGRSTSPPVHS